MLRKIPCMSLKFFMLRGWIQLSTACLTSSSTSGSSAWWSVTGAAAATSHQGIILWWKNKNVNINKCTAMTRTFYILVQIYHVMSHYRSLSILFWFKSTDMLCLIADLSPLYSGSNLPTCHVLLQTSDLYILVQIYWHLSHYRPQSFLIWFKSTNSHVSTSLLYILDEI